MKSGNRKTLKIILAVLAFFILVNMGWYFWRMVKYGSYCKGWEKNEFGSWIVPRYVYTDEDDYDYLVKYPEYLSFTGNMSVGLPATEENPFTDFLIIWPKAFGGYEYGASVTIGNQGYQIYIKSDGTAVNPEDSEIAASCQDTINDLLNRAKKMWNLE